MPHGEDARPRAAGRPPAGDSGEIDGEQAYDGDQEGEGEQVQEHGKRPIDAMQHCRIRGLAVP